MRRNESPHAGTVKFLRLKKVVTLAELMARLHCARRTVQRRLAQCEAINSYNRNGGCYALPDVPQFDAHGLWRYRGAFFSEAGNLPQTIVRLVGQSQAGLTAGELGQRLGLRPRSFMWGFRNHPALKREKHQGTYVYFASDPGLCGAQRHARSRLNFIPREPSASEAVAILVEQLKNPELSVEALCRRLQGKNLAIQPDMIRHLFARHGLAEKNATFNLIRCRAEYRQSLLCGVAPGALFPAAPRIEFRSPHTHCPGCQGTLKVQNTHARTVSTLLIGPFRAVEVVLACDSCGPKYRSEELSRLVPPGARFGYDALVYVGKALFLRYRSEEEVVAELAERNIRISPSEVSVLGRKFILYLALAHERCSPKIREAMRLRGGYVLHLDATCEGGSPMLMSSMDSLSEIVLGNVKLPSEAEEQIVPFLERFKKTFGIPLALVHDMGSGILKAVARVFPNVADLICHFHFLRDIGKDWLGKDYDLIRQRLRKHEINAKLRSHAKAFKRRIEPRVMDQRAAGIPDRMPSDTDLQLFPLVSAYSLILWTLEGKTQGEGYGFPFDQPHLSFAKRIQRLYGHLDQIKDLELRGQWRDNMPYFDRLNDLHIVINDRHLGQAVENIERNILIFERLRHALRIAPKAGGRGLNDEGSEGNIRSIEQRVKTFRAWITTRHDYPSNPKARNTITQLDKYWTKLFADPITVQTPFGPITIQPQRTNNLLEQFFRYLKRAHRRRTGKASSSRMLRAMLAETPLVKNLQNPAYLPALLNGKATIEEVFAEIDIATVREEFQKAQLDPDQIPSQIKHLIATTDYPEKLLAMLKKAVA